MRSHDCRSTRSGRDLVALSVLAAALCGCATSDPMLTSASHPRTSGPKDLSHPQPFIDTARPNGRPASLVFDSRSQRLFHGGEDKTVWVLGLPDWEPVQRFHLPTWQATDGEIFDLAISGDDRWLAVGGCQGCSGRWEDQDTYVFYVLDASTGEIKATGDLAGTTRDLAFSPDGRWLAVADYSNRISVWRVDPNGEIHRDAVHAGHSRTINAIRWSHDSQGFYSVGDDGLFVRWSTHDLGGWYPEWHKAHDVELIALEVGDKDEIYCSTWDGRIELVDAENGEFVENLLKLPKGRAFALALSDDGRRLAYGAGGGSGSAGWKHVGIGSVDISDGSGPRFARTKDTVTALAWSGREEDPIAALPSDGTISFYEGDRHNFIRAKKRAGVQVAWIGSDGNRVGLRLDEEDDHTIVFDLATLTRSEEPQVEGFTTGNGSVYESVRANHPRLGQIQATRRDAKRKLIYSVGGYRIYSWVVLENERFALGIDQRLSILNFTPNTRLDCWGHGGRVTRISWMRGGKLLLSVGDDRTFRVWNAETCELLVTFFWDGQDDWIAWTPDALYAHSEKGARLLGFRENRGAHSAPLLESPEDLPELRQPGRILEIIRRGTATTKTSAEPSS
jgi:WD40 repeat protein